MINNTVTVAEYKITEHVQKGTESNLSIFEVAQLMDVIHFGPKHEVLKKANPIYFNVHLN
jgi:hypothetical protein